MQTLYDNVKYPNIYNDADAATFKVPGPAPVNFGKNGGGGGSSSGGGKGGGISTKPPVLQVTSTISRNGTTKTLRPTPSAQCQLRRRRTSD
jgi:hypothetical protein